MRRRARRKGVRRRSGLPGAARRPTHSARVVSSEHLIETLEEALRLLREQRGQLDTRIQVIENALRTLRAGHQPTAVEPTRAHSLAGYIERVLAGGAAMTVKEITLAVVAAGYPTRNKTLAKSVGATLAKMPGVVKVGRGLYRKK